MNTQTQALATPTVVSAKNIVCIQLEIHLWSGYQTIKRENLIAAVGASLADLPPEALATMGTVKICDPTEVAVFTKLKGRAKRLLESVGLPILGSYGVPVGTVESVYAELTKIQDEFNTAANDLLATYDTKSKAWVKKWQAQNPGYAHLLNRLPKAEAVFGKLSFAFHAYSITAPEAAGPAAAHAFGIQLTGLKGELMRDAQAEAANLVTKYLYQDRADGVRQPREYITPKTLRPLARIASKLESFAFVDPSVGPLAKVINNVLSRMPTVGPIAGPSLVEVWNLSNMLMRPDIAARIGEMALNSGEDLGGEAIRQALDTGTRPPMLIGDAGVTDEMLGIVAPDAVNSIEDVCPVVTTPTANAQQVDAVVIVEPAHVVASAPVRVVAKAAPAVVEVDVDPAFFF